ncbi:MazG nucleotide pyrophosphohydrolase domain-containing protein [Pseudoclavibacter sp. AY1H1]|uniref:MazG nucleotide pyrophosphohydrolase domain-containing protein n=1 Tax=Pseudoclavibacter sp. AY1H1 TaxID=2080584 RepID=UPI000CE72739|nr:MazG nucleotide pyrophosphohydrolase domain-containing protein [Pseudoclavibacter sp. AY1H1]PPF39680.1 nucleoside triphosphate pyrophosphohydrolase [Pseudoclavibacter sp. AY1H1]
MGEASDRPELLRLLSVVEAFRGDTGCAWYEEQTHATLVKYLTEESAELIEALESDDPTDIREELGDVLFQVLFHSDIAAQRAQGGFTLEDVAREQADKLVRRNPHVFGPTPTRDIDEIIRLWQEAKAIEKRDRTSVLDGVPRGMSALALAQKLLGKERQLGAADVSPAASPAAASAAASPAASPSDSGWVGRFGMESKPSGSVEAIPKPGVGEEGAATGDAPDEELTLGRTLLALVRDADARGLDAERAMRLANRELEARIRSAEAEAEAEAETRDA